MPQQLFDSFRKNKVTFEPMVPGKIGMYLCGPTVYDSPHLGHARSAIAFDAIRRYLGWRGYDVTFVRNVTDVDDKIIKRANERGCGCDAITSRYTDEYNREMAALGLTAPDIEPKVTEHMPEIVSLIERLVANGKAYASGGDVYFEVASFPPYGGLSGQPLDQLEAGARVEPGEHKKSPLDFALWKAAKPGEPKWPSPWGDGRPGWHIECSAMTMKHLGPTFDIHAGGKDLVFPHHENEIAQSQGATGEGTYARYWMHNGFVNLLGEKMSKSLGNVFNIHDVRQAYDGESIRYFMLQYHYRSPINLEVEERDGRPVFPGFDEAERRLDYFYTTLSRVEEVEPSVPGELTRKTHEAMEDDFNTAVVIAALGEAAKEANKLLDARKAKEARPLIHEIRDVARGALGILGQPPRQFLEGRRDRLAKLRGIVGADVDRLLEARAAARAAKDFAKADAIRDEIYAKGVIINDTPRGAEWRVKE